MASLFRFASLVLATASLFAGARCAAVSGSSACTTLGCENGVRVAFTYPDAGSYVFEVTVDGQKTTCRATLPLPRGRQEACDTSQMYLTLVGSELPADQQSIGGIFLATTTAKRIDIRATKDGSILAESSVAPSYRVTPGPNGPDCEPKECKLASYDFP